MEMTFILNVIASLLLGFVWVWFFRQIDSFESESRYATFICLFLGMLSPLVTLSVQPFIEGAFDKSDTISLLNYAIFKVGAVEELSKILPFLVILKTSKWVDESVDFIKYPAISAIGFASVENILYAEEHGIDVLQLRAAISVPAHIFFSTVAGYFLWLGVKNQGRFQWMYMGLGFSIGVISHGLFDFFLFTGNTILSLVSLGMVVGFGFYLKKMVFHVVRDSHFYKEEVLPEVFRSGRILFLGLVILFFFIAISKWMIYNDSDFFWDYVQENGIPALIATSVLTVLIALDEKGFKKMLGPGIRNPD
jgi:RsiW-degrading membrane proteinase PrsW (M82 family)